MGLFFWKKNKLVDNFSMGLADEFFSSLPPDMIDQYLEAESKPKSKNKQDKKSARKVESVMSSTITHMKQFIAENKLGVYGKARMHMKFTDRLTELGYSEELAKTLNENIMLKVPN